MKWKEFEMAVEDVAQRGGDEVLSAIAGLPIVLALASKEPRRILTPSTSRATGPRGGEHEATRKKNCMIHPDVKNLISLLQRSKDVGDRWRQVSAVLWPHVQAMAATSPELFDLNEADSKIRLSEKGLLIVDYI